MKLGNQRPFFYRFLSLEKLGMKNVFLLEQPADKKGTQHRNSILFESLIYWLVKVKNRQKTRPCDINIWAANLISLFVFCNDMMEIYFNFFLNFFFFFCFSWEQISQCVLCTKTVCIVDIYLTASQSGKYPPFFYPMRSFPHA